MINTAHNSLSINSENFYKNPASDDRVVGLEKQVVVLEQRMHDPALFFEALTLYLSIVFRMWRVHGLEIGLVAKQASPRIQIVCVKIFLLYGFFFKKKFKMKITQRLLITLNGFLVKKFCKLSTSNNKYLRKEKSVDVRLFQKEIEKNEPLWTYNMGRKNMRNSPHVQTNAIPLFARNSACWATSLIDAHDNKERYGSVTDMAKNFPNILHFLLKFEEELGGQFGRVALVRLKPGSMVSGHSDSEYQLRGFDRYHLVVKSKKKSYMHVDDEHDFFSEGELFFFENKKWHTAFNASDDWRVHIILDIRLPENKCESLPIYSYADWKKWSHVKGGDVLNRGA